jgi:hypothetical protein
MRETVRDELEIPLSDRQPGPGRGHKTRDNITPFPDRGTSASYTLRRLKRDRPDLAERARGSGSKSA